MLSVFVGRVIRYMITAILTIEYGPEIVDIAGRLATRHRVALVIGLIVLLIGLAYWIWRTVWKRRGKRTNRGWTQSWRAKVGSGPVIGIPLHCDWHPSRL